MKYVITFAVQACTVVALLTYDLGMSWVAGGHGLHPVLAGALSFALFLTPYLIHRTATVQPHYRSNSQ